jgi:hypothetical protein
MSNVDYMNVETPFGRSAKEVQISTDGFFANILNTLLESYDKNFDALDPGLWALMQ